MLLHSCCPSDQSFAPEGRPSLAEVGLGRDQVAAGMVVEFVRVVFASLSFDAAIERCRLCCCRRPFLVPRARFLEVDVLQRDRPAASQ